MRRLVPILITLSVLLAFASTLAFLWTRAQAPEEEAVLETAQVRDIQVKTVATGSVRPRIEIAIKPSVSGVVGEIVVEPGDVLAAGDLIAAIRVVPDAASLARAEADVASAALRRDDAKRQLARVRELHGRGASSNTELEAAQVEALEAEQAVAAARRLLRIVRDGAAGGTQVATEVRSTVAGMVLDVAVEEGASVIESNTFNDGTTIAEIADMDDLVFEGFVDESEVGRIAEGMPLDITIGALNERRFAGTLEYISPKGVDEQGAVQFEIRAALDVGDGPFVRAGLSANADIVLDRREQVLAVREAVIDYEGGEPTVMTQVSEGRFERRSLELGISDGIWSEVVGGISKEDMLRVP